MPDADIDDLKRRVAALETAKFRLRGCICPARAEKTCKGFDCPRREMQFKAS